MSEEYTPTTEQVKRYWLYGADAWSRGVAGLSDEPDPADGVRPSEQFDRWLAAHDAEIREQVAREIEAMHVPIAATERQAIRNGAITEAAQIARGSK